MLENQNLKLALKRETNRYNKLKHYTKKSMENFKIEMGRLKNMSSLFQLEIKELKHQNQRTADLNATL